VRRCVVEYSLKIGRNVGEHTLSVTAPRHWRLESSAKTLSEPETPLTVRIFVHNNASRCFLADAKMQCPQPSLLVCREGASRFPAHVCCNFIVRTAIRVFEYPRWRREIIHISKRRQFYISENIKIKTHCILSSVGPSPWQTNWTDSEIGNQMSEVVQDICCLSETNDYILRIYIFHLIDLVYFKTET